MVMVGAVPGVVVYQCAAGVVTRWAGSFGCWHRMLRMVGAATRRGVVGRLCHTRLLTGASCSVRACAAAAHGASRVATRVSRLASASSNARNDLSDRAGPMVFPAMVVGIAVQMAR